MKCYWKSGLMALVALALVYFAWLWTTGDASSSDQEQPQKVTITGRVVKENNEGIRGVTVTAWPERMGPMPPVHTGNNGQYEIEVKSGPPLRLTFDHSEYGWAEVRLLSSAYKQDISIVLLQDPQKMSDSEIQEEVASLNTITTLVWLAGKQAPEHMLPAFRETHLINRVKALSDAIDRRTDTPVRKHISSQLRNTELYIKQFRESRGR